MALRTEEIEKLAALARISLSPEEVEKMRGEFDAILGYFATLTKLSTNASKGAPVCPPTGASARSTTTQVNVVREDENPHESGLYTEVLLSAAPQREGDYIKVKKIL